MADNDKARTMLVKGFYDADFYNSRLFHMILDSSLIPVDTAVAWITHTARLLLSRSFAGAMTTQEIDVDPISAETIDEVLLAA